MKRRIIPPALSLIALLATAIPAINDWISEKEWLLWTLAILAGLFVFTAGLFFWMRWTMIDQRRRLTIFGRALIDFFGAIVICFLGLALLFGSTYGALERGYLTLPFWARVADRSILVSGTVFVMSTGVAVAFEMHKARGHVRVHFEEGEFANSEFPTEVSPDVADRP